MDVEIRKTLRMMIYDNQVGEW